MMGNPVLLIFPLVNVVVTGLFAGMVLRQYMRRHRIYQLYWSIALSMAFLATLAYALMIVARPTSSAGVLFFYFYYILGAGLMPSWMGLGSIALVTNRLVTNICLTLLYVLSVLAIFFLVTASINMQQLSQIAGTPGAGVLRPGPWLVMIIVLNTLGVVAVAGVAAYSAWKLLQRQATVADFHAGNLFWANVLILAGTLLIATPGIMARLGIENIFWLVMALGWIVFFSGVLLTSATRSQRPAISTTKPVRETSRA